MGGKIVKVLVLGGTGMAGHVISIYLQEVGHEVTAFSRKKVDFVNNIIGDIREFEKLKQIIDSGSYDAIVNCIGILNENAEKNKSTAVLLNGYLPHFLSDYTRDLNTKIIHLSTDCVFSGKDGYYKESSFPDGPTFYDKSKAIGEVINNKDLTFRNSIIGPDLKESGIGLFNWFMNESNEVNGFSNAIWTGVTTITLAKAIDIALEKKITGLYHLVNNDTITKYELLNLFNNIIRDDNVKVNKYENRYVNKSLVNTREDFDFSLPTYEEMIFEMKEWILKYKECYPHYISKINTK